MDDQISTSINHKENTNIEWEDVYQYRQYRLHESLVGYI